MYVTTMLVLSLWSFALFLGLSYSADHDTFKDCSRVNFCTTLRSRSPQDKYSVDSSQFKISENGRVDLSLEANDGSANFNLSIFSLTDNRVRIQIKEINSTRHELDYVLDGKPPTLGMPKLTIEIDYVSIPQEDNEIRVYYSPFKIEFYTTGVLQTVFDGTYFTLENTLDQAFAFAVSFPQALQLYGIHEHADSLALQTTQVNGTDPYRLRNLDVSGYELNSPMALYGAVPVLYGHGPNGTAGIFLHNAAEQWVEITNDENSQAYIMVESGLLDLFVLLGPTPTEVVRQYVSLTGTAHLPQLWTLGYHQSRWNYESQDDVKDVVANFTTYNFPLDVIWLDIEYTDGKKYFTWDSNMFSDPVEMQQNISATNKRLVTIIDPHIKVETGYSVYDGALEKDVFVKNADGSNFEGDCWPGLSSYMDFWNPAARDYYSSFYSYDNFPSTTPVLAGIWNDMNEPSVFDNSIEKTLPGDALHYGGVVHRDIHNIYGLLHTMSTHQGLMARDNGTKRPFVLTRSHFAGTQRYSAIWTGDNTADWGYLSVSYSECLDANLLGIVFCGADIGGFENDPDVELLQRWYQAGVWLPFYRAHSTTGSMRREPYLFDEDVQQVIRNALQLRYKHLLVWYTLFYEHTRNKDPIIRPLFYHYPQDTDVYKISDHLLVGRDILVRAVAEPGVESVQVYFPGGADEHWISVDNAEVYDGNGFVDISVTIDAIPVYYRRGSVIVRKETVRLSSDEMANDGYTLYVNLDADNKASGTVYLDDNTSFNYVDNKEYNYLKIDMDGSDVTLTKIDEDSNSSDFDFIIDQVVVNKLIKEPENGKPGQYEQKLHKFDRPANVKLV
ncbi:hypothetical protein MTP99_009103 [Tenebrio molitor]|nr:hypothetical protein MTP99_009103 [Tenebrio molitor]